MTQPVSDDHATILVAPPGLPTGCVFGVDCSVWRTAPAFRGLSAVPAGIHFVHCAPTRTAGNQAVDGSITTPGAAEAANAAEPAFRSGFFVNLRPGEVLVRKWDPSTETLVPEQDDDQADRFRANLDEFKRFLGPYPSSQEPNQQQPGTSGSNPYQKWLKLSSHISTAVLNHFLPPSLAVSAMSSISHFSDVPIQPAASTTPTAPNEDENVRIHFTHINLKRSYPPGATGSLVTKYSVDKSFLLTSLLQTKYNQDTNLFLGELQLAFIVFLLGQVYDGFEQWKAMIQLVCFSIEATASHADLFNQFYAILQVQLEECPEDFFHDAIASESFLHACFKSLARTILLPGVARSDSQSNSSHAPDASVPQSVVDAGRRLLTYIQTRFDWDVMQEIQDLGSDEEDDEDKPVIVDI